MPVDRLPPRRDPNDHLSLRRDGARELDAIHEAFLSSEHTAPTGACELTMAWTTEPVRTSEA